MTTVDTAAPRGRHRTLTLAQQLDEDPNGAAAAAAWIEALQRELQETRAQRDGAYRALAWERWVRSWQDALIGPLVRTRDHCDAHAQYAYHLLRGAQDRLQQSGEIIAGLRRQLSGVDPL